MKDLLEKMCDAPARIERLILLAGAMGSHDAFPDGLNEFFDDEDEETIEKCLGRIPDWVNIETSGHERYDAVFEWLVDSNKLGFLVQFATPVMKPIGKNCRTYSWGHYGTEWIYADTLDEAIDKGMKWVKSCRRAEDRKAKKGGA